MLFIRHAVGKLHTSEVTLRQLSCGGKDHVLPLRGPLLFSQVPAIETEQKRIYQSVTM